MQEIKYLTTWHEYCEELIRARMTWEENVPCKAQGPNRMYPPSEAGQQVIANDVCRGCPAQTECLNLALVCKEDYGVWGGATEKQRRDLRADVSSKVQLSNRTIWRDSKNREAVLKISQQFVEKHNSEYMTANVGS